MLVNCGTLCTALWPELSSWGGKMFAKFIGRWWHEVALLVKHCLQTTARFVHRCDKYCHRERSRTTGTSMLSVIPNTLITNALQKHVIGSGVEPLVRQCNQSYITRLLLPFTEKFCWKILHKAHYNVLPVLTYLSFVVRGSWFESAHHDKIMTRIWHQLSPPPKTTKARYFRGHWKSLNCLMRFKEMTEYRIYPTRSFLFSGFLKVCFFMAYL